ncbi:hypothetical protein D5H75_23585 [Bailinhaonella thermotolerans]|uniref:Uncharacterized protein n=2 Tax=Bailinhaonella thermotolerans TaxID=1070861 RepID=A0A3A4B764_9ACTN|nr:hypothetical protein D5H75_23585 [Bailinhaonella thermotolerans]
MTKSSPAGERAGRLPERQLRAARAARRLCIELAEGHGITARALEGYGIAMLWVGPDAEVVVWTDGAWFRWWTGRLSRAGRRVYASGTCDNPATAARRVSLRYADLSAQQAGPGNAPRAVAG